MPLACKFEELDTATRDHLLAVRKANGRGAPGVLVSLPDAKPLWALIAGLVVTAATLSVAGQSHKGPVAVAALQTAGALTGGWLVLFAFRRWLADGGPVYPGRFLYFDPLNVYEVYGEEVRVTPLDGVNEIAARGGPTGPRVVFMFARGTSRTVGVPSLRAGERVEEYYAAMEELERDKAGVWANATTAELGAASLYAAVEDEKPRDTGDIDLDFETVPEEPKKANRAGLGVVGMVAVTVAGAGLFAMFFVLNHATRDTAAFNEATANRAPGLRAYLLDDRNYKHRDEAKQLLAAHYDAPVAKLSTASPGKVPELRAGMLKLVESLRASDSPAVSIRVTDAGGANERAKAIQQDVADSLARTVGPELIAFAAAPPDTPAMVEIVCASDPQRAMATATVTIRTSPTAAPVASAATFRVPEDGHIPLRDAILDELAGGYTPAPPPPDFGDF